MRIMDDNACLAVSTGIISDWGSNAGKHNNIIILDQERERRERDTERERERKRREREIQREREREREKADIANIVTNTPAFVVCLEISVYDCTLSPNRERE